MKTDHHLLIGTPPRSGQPGPVFIGHPVTESDPSACVVSRAYATGELVIPVAQQGRYRVWRGLNDVDDEQAVWYFDRVPDEATELCLIEIGWNGQTGRFVRCVLPKGHDGAHDRNDGGEAKPVPSFAIPLPVYLVAMASSDKSYILQDRWGWFWVVPPFGEPWHITEEKARAVMLKNGLDLVGQSFSTWEGLHLFRQRHATNQTEEPTHMSQPKQDPPTFDDALAVVIQALNDSDLIESVETTKSTGTGNDTAILTVIGRLADRPGVRFTLDLEVT